MRFFVLILPFHLHIPCPKRNNKNVDGRSAVHVFVVLKVELPLENLLEVVN